MYWLMLKLLYGYYIEGKVLEMLLHEVMLYVKNPELIGDFWEKHFDFKQVIETFNGVTSIQLIPEDEAQTRIIIFDIEVVRAMESGIDLATPSLMFVVEPHALEVLHKKLESAGVMVGEIVALPDGNKVFNFADPEGHYFAVRER